MSELGPKPKKRPHVWLSDGTKQYLLDMKKDLEELLGFTMTQDEFVNLLVINKSWINYRIHRSFLEGQLDRVGDIFELILPDNTIMIGTLEDIETYVGKLRSAIV